MLKVMTTSNRAINTGHAPEQKGMTLEATENVQVLGKDLKAGETIEVSRSEARRIMLSTKKLRVRMD